MCPYREGYCVAYLKVKYYCFTEDKDDKGEHKELLKHRDYKVMMI